jgi:hypothetical protein
MNWGIFKTDSVSEAYKKMKAEESSCDKDMKKEEGHLAPPHSLLSKLL